MKVTKSITSIIVNPSPLSYWGNKLKIERDFPNWTVVA